MPRQLRLDFGSSEKPSAPESKTDQASKQSVVEVADSLRGQLIEQTVPPTSGNPPPLIRSDRQIIFDSDDPEDWPQPVYDPEFISVDRPYNDIDGPPHRFVIRCADYIELLVSSHASSDVTRIGEALEIDHLRH